LSHSKISGVDKLERFTEISANLGSLGVFEAKLRMRHTQANAKAFDKYGALAAPGNSKRRSLETRDAFCLRDLKPGESALRAGRQI
jgi:hypothetical protein